MPALTQGQGGAASKQKTHRSTTIPLDGETAPEYWYTRPKGYMKDQAEARGWRLEKKYYIQRSGDQVLFKNMTRLDWRRELFIMLDIKDPQDS
eukprot:5076924-Heterocapsa_arctica.AAC.1